MIKLYLISVTLFFVSGILIAEKTTVGGAFFVIAILFSFFYWVSVVKEN